jgi:maltooligosyltrehalose synthase
MAAGLALAPKEFWLGCNAYLTLAFRAREAGMSLACSNLVVRDGGAAKSVMQWWGDVFGLGGRTALLRHYDVKHHERP